MVINMKKYLYVLILLLFPLNVLAYSNKVILGGQNIGIKINSNGVMVVGFYKINNKINKNKLNIGDYIIKVENNDVNNVDELIKAIENNVKDNKVNITYRHNDKEYNTSLSLENIDNIYKTGIYVKDNIKGLGTLTYIDPESKIFGCLGHEIIESSSNKKMEIKDGSIFKAEVSSITKSRNGNVGSKNAKFNENNSYGNILKNEIQGIYGKYDEAIDSDDLIEISPIDKVKEGIAYIYTELDDKSVKQYKINILKIDKNNKTKNYYFEVIDTDLINKTGGIVQGMSGSPIVQDGKLIGAVTHVSLDSVIKGYGISIVNMLEVGEK